MKIAIIGGGSAGFMAAAYLSRVAPMCPLTHIYDSNIPRIGVGEGTTPPFVRWIDRTIGLEFDDLERRCLATHKAGIHFENWGAEHPTYLHYFSPRHEGPAYHISADRLVDVLEEYVEADVMDRNVADLVRNEDGVEIVFTEGPPLQVDLVLDARGFPRELTDEHERLSCIPTNAAAVQRGPRSDFRTATRAVARPHGWIFIIPLTEYTSYGYVHNSDVVSNDELEADFDAFLAEEDVVSSGDRRFIPFPNFVHRRIFDGAIFRIGNAASFIEPLEATALAVILYQLNLASFWVLDRVLGLSRPETEPRAAERLNDHLVDYVREIALFIGWHYAEGSRFETPFWDFARGSFSDALRTRDRGDPEMIARFERFVREGARFPRELIEVTDDDRMDDLEAEGPAPVGDFGGFLNMSFGKVGHGIAAYGNGVPA